MLITPIMYQQTINQKTILLVEDDKSCQLLTQFHIPNDIKVVIANNGIEALHILKNHKLPNLIISDINMPKMDGIKLFECLSKDTFLNKIPITFISGEDLSARKINKLINNGIKAFYQKPVNKEIIREIISNYMKGGDI